MSKNQQKYSEVHKKEVVNGNDRDQREQVRKEEEVQHSSYTHTDVRVPITTPNPVYMSSGINMQELIGEGMHVNVSRISSGSQEAYYESPEIAAEAQRDYEEKQREVDLMKQAFEKELERRTEVYRKQQEEETEKIRKELEKQHLRDVEFRQNLVEAAIENQKKQIDLEARYAKRDMDRQKRSAKASLERDMFKQEVQVNIESGAGSTVSGGLTQIKQEKEVRAK